MINEIDIEKGEKNDDRNCTNCKCKKDNLKAPAKGSLSSGHGSGCGCNNSCNCACDVITMPSIMASPKSSIKEIQTGVKYNNVKKQ